MVIYSSKTFFVISFQQTYIFYIEIYNINIENKPSTLTQLGKNNSIAQVRKSKAAKNPNIGMANIEKANKLDISKSRVDTKKPNNPNSCISRVKIKKTRKSQA